MTHIHGLIGFLIGNALLDSWRDRSARTNFPFLGRMFTNPILTGPSTPGLVEGLFGSGGLLGSGPTAPPPPMGV